VISSALNKYRMKTTEKNVQTPKLINLSKNAKKTRIGAILTIIARKNILLPKGLLFITGIFPS